ncbi:MAG: pyridoxamine 5'-phosphate oxidase family protein [Bacteroidota bacterium]
MIDLLSFAKAELLRSNVDRRHPFRFFQLATLGDYPEVRTVVKRKMDADFKLTCFTDARTTKVSQIDQNPRVSALFYDRKKQLQVRMKGEAQLIRSGMEGFAPFLEQVKQAPSLLDYTCLRVPGSPYPQNGGLTFGDEIHLLVIELVPTFLDVLQLNREEHLRMAYTRTESGWQAQRWVP